MLKTEHYSWEQINRLVMFQNSCLKSVTSNTYQFDRWLMKFLLEHALVLEEKTEEDTISWPDIDVDMAGNIHVQRSRVTQSIIMDMQNN